MPGGNVWTSQTQTLNASAEANARHHGQVFSFGNFSFFAALALKYTTRSRNGVNAIMPP